MDGTAQAMSEQALSIDPAPVPVWRQPRVLDRVEQVGILLLWSWFILRVGEAHNPFAWLAAVSETSVAVFTLIRRPTSAISVRLGDWMLAMTATLAPLMVVFGESRWPQLLPLCVVLVVCGNLFQIWAKLTLRRSFGIAPANRGIKRGGPYRYVRHPMYAGYLFNHLGVLLMWPSLINLAAYGIGWTAQILRLRAEEELLGQDASYREFMGQTRWRLLPGIF